MKNFIQPGNVLTVAAPTGGVSSGDVVNIGSLIGVAAFDALQGAEVEVQVEGVFEVPKASADDVSVGEALYWDDIAAEMTVEPGSSGLPKAGYAATAAGAGATLVKVRLTPGAA